MRNKTLLYNLILGALFLALVFVVTKFLQFPNGITGGFVSLGDTFIYFAASILPTPFAIVAGFGAALSDATSAGAVVYVIPDIIIKTLLVLFFTYKNTNIICKRNIVAIILAGLTGLVGYYFTDVIIFRNFISPIIGDLLIGSLQPILCAVAYVIVGTALDKAKIKQRIKKFN
jgi:uncharacterized repeat protein (TIGR04002 family)